MYIILSICSAFVYTVVFAVLASLLLEVTMPGEFVTLHKIYKTVLEINFEDEEES